MPAHRWYGLWTRVSTQLLLAGLLASCSSFGTGTGQSGSLLHVDQDGGTLPRFGANNSAALGQTVGPGGTADVLEYGASAAQPQPDLPKDATLDGIAISLDFVDTDVREFSRVFFSELLHRPYVVDQKINGSVTLRSGGKVDGNTALALASRALEASGNSLSISDGVYRISSKATANRAAAGNARTFALRFIDGATAQEAIGGLIGESGQIIAATKGSLSIRGDNETLALVASLLETIDIDRFKSSSFGLITLRSAEAETVALELEALYAGVGIGKQTILPIQRMNAVLLIADKPDYLTFAQKWLDRLDHGQEDRRQIFVYQVQNRKAPELATLLQEVFASVNAGSSNTGPAAAPPPATAIPDQVDSAFAALANQPGAKSAPQEDGGIRITADPDSNTLVVWARPEEYKLIEGAMRRLDTPLKQVFVEATIAEVRLNGQLSHGVRWFFEAGNFGIGITDASNGAVSPEYPGFNFSFQVPNAQVVISALESYTDVRIVSSPQLTVVDRESATIQVGDQVPIATKSVQEGAGKSGVITNDITFRDTGVILKITPEIRQSGEVLLNIDQEVSRVVPTTSSTINSPTISQRKVSSTVLIPDGTAIVLGGLMNSSQEEGGGGLPGTQKTILGALFGSEKNSSAKSELIVIVRPRILQSADDLRAVVREIASKMDNVVSVD